MLELTLPFPPSLGGYYRMWKGRWLISKKGREYRKTVELICAKKHISKITSKISVRILAFVPDRRRRDCDNLLKGILDSMEHGGVYEDDSQVRELSIKMMPPSKDPRVEIRIEEL